MPAWPGSTPFELVWTRRLDQGNSSNNSKLCCDSHAGTHVDAPYHFTMDGLTVDQLPLKTLIGPCRVVSLKNIPVIDVEVLESLALPDDVNRLLFKTDNSDRWTSQNRFDDEYVCLADEAAKWLVRHTILLVGIDYLSIGSYRDGVKTHQILLSGGIIIIEGLNLSCVDAGDYELICLPLNPKGAEAAPARVVLRSL